ncbi:MAG: DUF2939 domain-containing protein [Moraxella sp.]|nr:DUF2939 domain-containing protein [Moraxella sp.]
MKTQIKLIIGLVLMLVVAMALSPYYQLYRFKTAYEQGDYTPIIHAIDYDTLRPSIKSQLHQKLDGFVGRQGMTLVLPMMGIKPHEIKDVGARFIDTAVDSVITPDGLTLLSQGQIPKDGEPLLMALVLWLGGDLLDLPKLAQDYLTTGDIHTAIAGQSAIIARQASNLQINPTTPDMGYCGLNCFFIKTTIKDKPISVIMTRHWFINWQISDIILP